MLKLSQVDHASMDHTGGSSVQVDICPVTGGSSVQVDICPVTASFTWHNVLKVHPGFCTLQDFLPFKGQIIFHCVYMWHFLGPCIHSGTFKKFQLSIVKISNCKHVGKGRSVNTRMPFLPLTHVLLMDILPRLLFLSLRPCIMLQVLCVLI